MERIQDIIRCLLAISSAISEDGRCIHLLVEEENSLIEKRWTGSEFSRSTFITDYARNSPASYVLGLHRRLVLCLGESNILVCHEYNATEGEWERVSIENEKDIRIHSKSRLSSCFTDDGVAVFFHDSTGQFTCAVIKNSSWHLESISADPAIDTPHHVISMDGKLHFFFMSKDNVMHHQIKDHRIGKWEDHILENSNFNSVVDNFIVALNVTEFEVCFLTADNLVLVTETGTRHNLGRVKAGRFAPDSNAEDVTTAFILLPKLAAALASNVRRFFKKR